jgi:hypothetical protein
MAQDRNETSENIGRQTTQGMQQGGLETGTIRNEDVGGGERNTLTNADHQGILFSNDKKTYDLILNADLHSINRRDTHANELDKISIQALQNAVETANIIGKNTVETSNMTGKQAHRHSDLAMDRQWNVDEQAHVVKEILNDPAIEDAMKVLLVGKITDAGVSARAGK